MIEDQVPSGQPSEASGETQDEIESPSKKDTVKYDTYQKVLSEKKRRDEALSEATRRIHELESANKQREEEELKAKENYKKLLEMRENELKSATEKLTMIEQQNVLSKKAQAFLGAVGGLKKNEYLELVDFDQIPLTDDGQVDQMSLEKYRDLWKTKFPETLMDSKVPGTPNEAPKGSSKQESREELLAKIAKNFF